MITELGAFALVLSLMLSVAQTGLSAVGGARRSPVLAGAGRGAAVAAFVAVAVAFAALIHAFVVSDFSVANVAGNSHTAKPMLVQGGRRPGAATRAPCCCGACPDGLWRGHGGVRRELAAETPGLRPGGAGRAGRAVPGLCCLRLQPAGPPAGGPGRGTVAEPLAAGSRPGGSPAVPLPAAMSASRWSIRCLWPARSRGGSTRHGPRWVRPWTLAAWSLLTVGITLGAFWAYYELGWGGWWFWDPVENASFMPWLIGAALLHSAIVTEKARRPAGLDGLPALRRLYLLDAGRLPGALGRADQRPRLRRRSDARRPAADHDWGPRGRGRLPAVRGSARRR